MKILFASLICCFLFVGSAPSQDDVHINKGTQFMDEFKYPEAIAEFDILIQYFVRQENGEIIYHRTESGFRNYRTIISVVTNHYHKKPRIFKLNMFCAEKNLKKV